MIKMHYQILKKRNKKLRLASEVLYWNILKKDMNPDCWSEGSGSPSTDKSGSSDQTQGIYEKMNVSRYFAVNPVQI